MLIVAIVAGFILAGYVLWWVGDRVLVRRDKTFALGGDSRPTADPTQEPPLLETLDKALSSNEWVRRLLMKLMRAGVGLRPSEFVGITGGISLLLAVVLALLVHFPGIQFLGLAIGIAGAWIYLESKCARRLTAFNIQLPDALSLIGSALRSGAGFERAAALVRDEMPSPISDEFGRMIAEVRIGVPLEDSLARMVGRVRSYDLELATVAVTVNRQVGGNLAEVLDKICGMIRERVRLEREVSALTVEGRLSGLVLLILPFVVAGLIITLNPSYLSVMLTNSLGQMLIAAAIALQLVGALIIHGILRTDY
jgi:tight adherence protein B